MQYTHLIFDLDGTLSNPDEGIRHSIDFALKKLNIDMDISEKYFRFIGPPLHEGFQKGLGLSAEQT
jgi:phosphoglycolate phosphatase